MILFLKKRKRLTTNARNKVKIMFEIYFSFSSMIFINDVKKFFYFLSIDDDKSFTNRKIIKIVYKVNSNKISKIDKIINKALYQFINIIIKLMYFSFDRCIKKDIQLLYCKRSVILILQKFDKENYAKLSFYKSIKLLNTLNKILNLIILKRIYYIVKTLNIFFNT